MIILAAARAPTNHVMSKWPLPQPTFFALSPCQLSTKNNGHSPTSHTYQIFIWRYSDHCVRRCESLGLWSLLDVLYPARPIVDASQLVSLAQSSIDVSLLELSFEAVLTALYAAP